MKFFEEKFWDKLSLPDWRSRFFIESFSEALSIYTPHFYQARLMCITNLAEEVMETIEEYERSDKGKGYLASSLVELKQSFENDEIAKVVFGDIKPIFDSCAKNFTTEKFQKSLIYKLSIICKLIVSENEVYFETLISALKDSLLDRRDITHKDRLTKEINSITRTYVSYLLSIGYSPTFLYNKMEMFTRANNYGGRTFNQQFEVFINSLDCKKRSFNVFFAIKTNKKSTLSTYCTFKNSKVLDSIPEKHYTISTKTFSQFEPDLYYKFTVDALDYVSAAWKASDDLESEIDYLLTLSPNTRIELFTSCYVDYKAKGKTFQRSVRINLLNNMLTYDQRGDSLAKLLHVYTSEKLIADSKKRLEGALKNIRIARETSRVEQKLINLWIALETLSYSTDEQSIISGIVNYTPKAYALNSISDRLRYVLDLLSKAKTEVPSEVLSFIGTDQNFIDKTISIEQLYKIIADKNLAVSIYNNLGNYDLIKFRIISLHNEIKDKEKVKDRIQKTHDDVEKHLYRIYRYRNNVTHNGYVPNLSPYVINHLADYVHTLISIILNISTHSSHLKELTLNDIMLSSLLTVESIFDSIKKNNFDKLEDLIPSIII